MHTFRTSILAIVFAGPLWAAVESGGDVSETLSARDIEAYRHHLYRRHLVCGDAALRGGMHFTLAKACSLNFLALKLSFVPGASLERFEALSPADRARANALGYAGFRMWLRDRMTAATDR